jgi:hypothetical protein
MTNRMRLLVRVCGWMLLAVGLFGLTGRDNTANLVDKASISVALFLAHFGVLARLGLEPGLKTGLGRTVSRIALGVVGGAIGGYLAWNALQYLAVGLHGGRFDLQASWGALLLAVGLGYSVAAPSPTSRGPAAAAGGR